MEGLLEMTLRDRRDFLKAIGAASTIPLLGSFALANPRQLILPTQEDKTIVLATEVPPDPLGFINYRWAQVSVERHTQPMYSLGDLNPWYVQGAPVEVTITGFTTEEELKREAAFFNASKNGEMLRIYFAKAS